jgi:hypothetical protein
MTTARLLLEKVGFAARGFAWGPRAMCSGTDVTVLRSGCHSDREEMTRNNVMNRGLRDVLQAGLAALHASAWARGLAKV